MMEDDAERIAVENHLNTLWNFMQSKDDFEFKSIQDILNDLDTCQTKNAGDIKVLKDRTKDLMGKKLLDNFKPGSYQIKHLVVLASKSLDTRIIISGASKQSICNILQYFAKCLQKRAN